MTRPCRPRFHTNQQDTPTEASGSTGILKKSRSQLAGSFVLLALLLIATLILSSIGSQTRRTADRAQVRVEDATIVGPLVQHNVPKATISFHNSGRSMAVATRIRLVMTIWPSDRFPDWDMPLKLSSDVNTLGDMAPEAVVPQTVSLLESLTDVQGMHLERKDWFIVILGLVSYEDHRGHSRETTLCFVWRELSTEHLSPCEKWNEAN